MSRRDDLIDMAAALWSASRELDAIMRQPESWARRSAEYVLSLRRAYAVGWPEDVAESAWHIVEDAMQHIADGRVPDEETMAAWMRCLEGELHLMRLQRIPLPEEAIP